MWIAILIVVAVALLTLGYWWLSRNAAAINDYFVNAVTVYAMRGDDTARVAALAAATVAAGEQRQSMLVFLNGMAGDIVRLPDGRQIQTRLLSLAEEIKAKDSALATIRMQKEHLSRVAPDLLVALNKSDASVFARKWPELF